MIPYRYLLMTCSLAAGVHPAAGQIQDNSFLIEEAYNQEANVVQHISTFSRMSRNAHAT